VSDIAIPCKVLLAEDDPIVSSASLDAYNLPANVSVFKTKKGGHMGYLGTSEGSSGFYWLDSLLVDWIREF
jgi:predicted alpha/beta-fold hydrolase